MTHPNHSLEESPAGIEVAPEWEPLRQGELLDGKYRIGVRLGTGAMGIVYRAEHTILGIPIALKVMRGEFAAMPGGLERMLREARAAARLRSEHIVRVLDVGRLESGLPFIIMEFLEGQNLAELLQRSGPLAIEQALDFVQQACVGLAEAHAAGILHRDLKPENLFLTHRSGGSPLIKVFDFGVSKDLGSRLLRVTQDQTAVGSPAYMSPEQMRAETELDARSDIWALGVVLTELCTGRLPFDANTLIELYTAVQQGVPQLPSHYDPSLPRALDEIVKRCLQPDPRQRFLNTEELDLAIGELQAVLSGGRDRASVLKATSLNWAATAPPAKRVTLARKVAPLGILVASAAVIAGLAVGRMGLRVEGAERAALAVVDKPNRPPLAAGAALVSEPAPQLTQETPLPAATPVAPSSVAPPDVLPEMPTPELRVSSATVQTRRANKRSDGKRPLTSLTQPKVTASDEARLNVEEVVRLEPRDTTSPGRTSVSAWNPDTFGGRR